MRIIGVDPGASGAIAILDEEAKGYRLRRVVDMPTKPVIVSGKPRNRVDEAELFRCLDIWGCVGTELWLERVSGRPMQGPGAAFVFGESYGLVRGIAEALGFRVHLVSPMTWKLAMVCPTDKGQARARAQDLFPDSRQYFERVKDDGRAEAAMIALYGLLHGRSDAP